ncbi:hypothetical protein FRC0191_01880 [Corynebacterium diphtheriae]|uniref:helix-turn-helix domain-containing protein n=1 Tax=Corynebacterium diphtheriae TaxID=1717 RepID=UPI0013CB6D94|nr:helix-turn-helix domain-containing protein [Corynebacterium diphtheriae]MBG9306407.1 helix-turn-helix domain-containing protein [Corynebacterium diphtheriae bv. mitis]CAB0812139.1 hypothetical protein FRC0191_01880 [Corynebacterium diphtheriae]
MTALVTTTPAVTLQGQHLVAVYTLAAQGLRNKNTWNGLSTTPIEREALDALHNATIATRDLAQRHNRHQPNPQQQDSWLTSEELAKQMHCSTRTIQRKAKHLGGIKDKGEWRFPPHLRDTP